MDEIKITGIRAYGYTGVLPEEQILGQWFAVDLTIGLDLKEAGKSDKLQDTFDYRQAIALVEKTIDSEKFALIEKLASVIVEKILTFDKVQRVQIDLVKLAPPIPNFSGNVTICLTREKNATN